MAGGGQETPAEARLNGGSFVRVGREIVKGA